MPAADYLKDNLPPKVYRDPLKEGIVGNGSDFLEGFFDILKLPVSKGEYWEVAQEMNKDEIPPEVLEMLDSLYKFLKKE